MHKILRCRDIHGIVNTVWDIAIVIILRVCEAAPWRRHQLNCSTLQIHRCFFVLMSLMLRWSCKTILKMGILQFQNIGAHFWACDTGAHPKSIVQEDQVKFTSFTYLFSLCLQRCLCLLYPRFLTKCLSTTIITHYNKKSVGFDVQLVVFLSYVLV